MGENLQRNTGEDFCNKDGEQDMKKKRVVCLELQRGQVSYKKIRRKDGVKWEMGGCYTTNKKQTVAMHHGKKK